MLKEHRKVDRKDSSQSAMLKTHVVKSEVKSEVTGYLARARLRLGASTR